MKQLDIAFQAVWLLLGIAVCVGSYGLTILGPSGPDSGFFPALAGAAMTIGAAAMLVSRQAASSEFEPFIPADGSAARVALVLAIMVAMIAALPWLGFNIAGSLGMALLLRAIGRPSWLFAILFGTASTAIVFYVFDNWLGMSLPRGPLRF